MTIKLSTSQRNAMAQALEDDMGGTPVLKIFTGAAPTNDTDPNSGTELVSINLPVDAFNVSNGVLALSSAVNGTGIADGSAGHYRLYNTDGTTVAQQGAVGQGSGDLSIDNVSIAIGQTVNLNGYSLTMPNA